MRPWVIQVPRVYCREKPRNRAILCRLKIDGAVDFRNGTATTKTIRYWIDYPYVEGNILNPFTQNVLKGDYPIIGQHTFLNITAESETIAETRQVPTPQNGFDSTTFPGGSQFFGNPNQFAFNQFFRLSFDLFHGDTAFKPIDWRIKLTPVFNMNYLDVQELGVVSPDVADGRTRFRDYLSLEEWFFEMKLADLSPDYDFLSVRLGSQPFVSDFRGFIFRRHQPGRAFVRHAFVEPRPVQSRFLRPTGKGHG